MNPNGNKVVISIGKYMYAEPIGFEPREVYTVHARDGSILGYAEWYPRWREYVFMPDSGAAVSRECCEAMAKFLDSCNRAAAVLRYDDGIEVRNGE
jgi:hypothetical protein